MASRASVNSEAFFLVQFFEIGSWRQNGNPKKKKSEANPRADKQTKRGGKKESWQTGLVCGEEITDDGGAEWVCGEGRGGPGGSQKKVYWYSGRLQWVQWVTEAKAGRPALGGGGQKKARQAETFGGRSRSSCTGTYRQQGEGTCIDGRGTWK